MVNYKHLLAFVTVVRKKSFTVAAKELFLTQPAISWQIKNLENEVDLVLIERKERGTKLTEAGKQFYLYAEKIIKAYEQLMEEMKQLKCMEKGRLLVGASTVPGEYILPKYMGLFKETYPSTDVIVSTGPSEIMGEKLLNGDIHMGVIGAKLEDSRIESKLFLQDEIVMVCRTGHPLADKKKVTLDNVIEYPLIVRERESGVRHTLEDSLSERGYRLRHFPYYTELSGSHSGITGVQNSDAVSFVSNIVAKENLANGTINVVDIADFKMPRNIYIIYNQLKTLSPLSETFLEFMMRVGQEKTGKKSTPKPNEVTK